MAIKRDNIKFAGNLVNLTRVRVCVYNDTTGEIECFRPLRKLHDVIIAARCDDPYFVVETMSDAVALCDFLEADNVAIIESKSVGRNGWNMSNLVWAKNPIYRVLLRRADYKPV